MDNGSEKTGKPGGNGKPEKKPGKGRKPVRILLIVVVVAALAAAASYRFLPDQFAEALGIRAGAEEKKVPLKSFDFGGIVVNLADKTGNRYFRVSLVLEFEDNGLAEKELKEKGYRIRDELVFLLRQKTTVDLRAPEGGEQLRKEVIEAINKQLKESKIKQVYFTEFIVQ